MHPLRDVDYAICFPILAYMPWLFTTVEDEGSCLRVSARNTEIRKSEARQSEVKSLALSDALAEGIPSAKSTPT